MPLAGATMGYALHPRRVARAIAARAQMGARPHRRRGDEAAASRPCSVSSSANSHETAIALMFRRILVPIDGSAHARRALAEAVELASASDAALAVMTVVPTSGLRALGGGRHMPVDLDELLHGAERSDRRSGRRRQPRPDLHRLARARGASLAAARQRQPRRAAVEPGRGARRPCHRRRRGPGRRGDARGRRAARQQPRSRPRGVTRSIPGRAAAVAAGAASMTDRITSFGCRASGSTKPR